MPHGQPVQLAAPSTSTLRCVELPWLTQTDYDRLLWACDLNFVRGEDSLVRALWAGAPFVWQIYAQDDGAHAVKLQRLPRPVPARRRPRSGERAARAGRGWNGLGPWPATLPQASVWRTQAQRFRDALLAQPDLSSQLLGFVAKDAKIRGFATTGHAAWCAPDHQIHGNRP